MNQKDRYQLKILRRPWYEWLGWALWLFGEIFFLQNAIASKREFESPASMIFWGIFITLALGGLAAYISRRINLMEGYAQNEEDV